MIKPRNSVILQANCVRCHKDFVAEINTHPGHSDKMLDCMQCHRDVGHGPVK